MKLPNGQYLCDDRALTRWCERVADVSRVGLDTEFVGEDTFVPRLELIQVATEHGSAVIDIRTVTSLSPLAQVMGNPSVQKIFHAGRQDLELLQTHTGIAPKPFFDTQIAAAMVGYGPQIGYAQLVQRVLGQTVTKGHTMTNWSQRPLTKDQLAYALADVDFLLPLHQHLLSRLRALKREDWVREEFELLGAKPTDASNAPRSRFERIRGWETLKPKSCSVLRELAAWREGEARRRNLPRGRIARDEILLELARQTPTSLNGLRAMRGLSTSLVERYGEVLLALIRNGLETPASQHPRPPKVFKLDPETAGRTELLQAVLKACAQHASIAPTLLATAADLQALVQGRDRQETLDLSLLKGWRRQLAGEVILEVLEGKKSVRVDPRTGRVVVVPSNGSADHSSG